MDEGYLFGVWETGPWLAYKGSNDTVHEWVALGENFLHDFQIWRHSCFSIDFEAGKIRLVENGETRHEMNSLELLRPRTINFVSIGCYYKSSEYMSMVGKVTDLQIFSKELSEEEMKRITTCEEREEGDVLSWKSSEWVLSGKGNIEEEMLDLQQDICKVSKKSFHLIPHGSNFLPEGVNSCRKLGGIPAEYSSQAQLEQITKYLSQSKIANSPRCKADDKLNIWISNTDAETEEGRKTHSSAEKVTYLSWDAGRPK